MMRFGLPPRDEALTINYTTTHQNPEGSDIQTTSTTEENLDEVAGLLSQDQLPEGWSWVGSSATAKVAFHSENKLYYKEFLPRTPLERIKNLLRGSRATRARASDEALRGAGFNAPVNVAWDSLPRHREFLISRSVDGQGITVWLRETLKNRTGATLGLRRQLLTELGLFIGRLHASGFIHGDLRTNNVLAVHKGQRFSFSLIDNERTRHYSPPPGKTLLRNLMQLNMLLPADLTNSDRWRFFLAWQTQNPQFSREEARLLARESYRWAMKRLRGKGLV
jgi:tRNA A-37 threonylcarbamoyl transferase component Bud32